MRRLTRSILLLLVLVILALWSPWLDWNIDLDIFDVNRDQQSASLQVTSLAGELEVYIDDESEPAGTVNPENSPVVIPGISPGDHQIRLTRVSEVENAYWDFNEIVTFREGADVILTYELGPSQEFSEGHMIFAMGSVNTTAREVLVNITTDVGDAEIFIDDIAAGRGRVEDYPLGLESQHKVIIQAPGYERQEFVILPEAEDDRDKLAGTRLMIRADLFLQPIRVVNE